MAGAFDLKAKTALVTGGAKRIGRSTCAALAQAGASVLVHYHTSREEAAETCREVEGLGVRAWAVQADLGDPAACEGLVTACLEAAGQVDILINSASSFAESRPADLDLPELALALQLHALAPLQLARGLLGIPPTRPGRVVNLLDAYLHRSQRRHLAYNLSKRALLTLTETLAVELAPLVTVNAVAPGMILTAPGQSEGDFERMSQLNPLQRRGEVQDVVEAVLYLLRADYVTGQVLYVDGGARLPR